MAWITTADPQEFLDAAGGFLRRRPAGNTVPLTAVAGLLAGQAPYGEAEPLFGWWRPGAAVTGAFMHTPPFPLYLCAPPERALAPLADLLAARGRRLLGVDGGGDQASAFAAAWTRSCADAAVPHLHLRLYRLARLAAPPAPDGRATVASSADRDLVIAWIDAFSSEVGTWTADSTRRIDERLTAGAYTLWRDDAGEPVAFAGVSREVAGSRRLGPVFTRADRRGRGYGGAVTAAVCRRALDEGAAQLLLFADAKNAVSNRLYRRLGFEHVEDRRAVRFERTD